MFVLPENRGFAELKTDREAAARGSRRKPVTGARILAYFYQPDGATPMSPGPSEVKVKLGTDENNSVVVLSNQTKEPGLYASEPGPYPEGIRGQIEARFDGDPVPVPFLFR